MTTNTHGGQRPGAGRKPNETPSQRIVIHATDAELEAILRLTPRERTEAMKGHTMNTAILDTFTTETLGLVKDSDRLAASTVLQQRGDDGKYVWVDAQTMAARDVHTGKVVAQLECYHNHTNAGMTAVDAMNQRILESIGYRDLPSNIWADASLAQSEARRLWSQRLKKR